MSERNWFLESWLILSVIVGAGAAIQRLIRWKRAPNRLALSIKECVSVHDQTYPPHNRMREAISEVFLEDLENSFGMLVSAATDYGRGLPGGKARLVHSAWMLYETLIDWRSFGCNFVITGRTPYPHELVTHAISFCRSSRDGLAKEALRSMDAMFAAAANLATYEPAVLS